MADTVADVAALAALWDETRNGRPASAVLARSYRTAWWTCRHGHAFQRKPRMMSKDPSCPECAISGASLADTRPHLARRWHHAKNGASPSAVTASHTASVFWVCDEGHSFERSPLQMVADDGCPHAFVESLLGHVNTFTPSEMFALAMQAGVLRGAASRSFVRALTTGRFPVSELEKIAANEPSLVDEFANNADFSLELQEAQATADRNKDGAPDDRFALPQASDRHYDDGGELDVSAAIASPGERDDTAALDDGTGLPVIETRDALAALDSELFANADAETVKFLRDSAKAKLWRHAYQDPGEAER